VEEVAREENEADARRRYYRLTALGRGVLAAEISRLEALVSLARPHLELS
jgi:DNA-binding MarR family transcriptional regulator